MRSFALFALGFALAIAAAAQSPDAREIIRKSTERDFYNFNAVKNYTYKEREENKEYDTHGKLRHTSSETDDVIILGGRPYEKLIAKNDKPLSEKEARHEQEKMDKESAKREHMSAADVAKVEKEREDERAYLREIPDAFDFKLLADDTISGKPAWVIQADPKPGYKPKDSKAKLLTKIRGKIWIDQKDYRWVKMEAEVLGTFSYAMNLLRINPGSTLLLEQTRVNDEVWLPSRILVRGNARLAYVKKMNMDIDVTYSDYKKFQTDSHLVSVAEK